MKIFYLKGCAGGLVPAFIFGSNLPIFWVACLISHSFSLKNWTPSDKWPIMTLTNRTYKLYAYQTKTRNPGNAVTARNWKCFNCDFINFKGKLGTQGIKWQQWIIWVPSFRSILMKPLLKHFLLRSLKVINGL